MRYGLVVVATGAIFAIGYAYGPNIYQYILGQRPVEERAVVPAIQEVAKPVASVDTASPPLQPIAPKKPVYKKAVYKKVAFPKGTSQSPVQPKAPKLRSPQPKPACSAKAKAPITPGSSASAASASAPLTKQAAAEKPRTKWRQELEKARSVSVFKGEITTALPCSNGGVCNRDREDRDVLFAGVVLTIDRDKPRKMARHSLTSRGVMLASNFQGKLRTGTYLDKTPMVYLE